MYISSQFPVSRFSVKTFFPEEKEFDRELQNRELSFSHTFLPRTNCHRASRKRGGRKRWPLHFVKQGPIRRGTRLRAPTSHRRRARGRPSRAHPPGDLFSLCRQRARAE